MIIRTWRGRASESGQGAYISHFKQNVIPELRGIEGFLSASLLRRGKTGEIEFFVVTKWASMDAIRAFAGSDVTRAVVEPEAIAALVDFDRTVEHYEVLEEARSGNGS